MTEGFDIKTNDPAVAALARRVVELTEAVESVHCHNLAHTVMVRAFLEQLRQRYRLDTDGAADIAMNALEAIASAPADPRLTPDTISRAQRIVADMFKPMQAPEAAKRDKFAVIGGGKDTGKADEA